MSAPAPLAELARSIARGERTATQETEAALARIEAEGGALGALLDVDAQDALERARALDASDEPRGPLHGVPIALKANLCRRGALVSCGSRALEDWRAPYDASAVTRLLAAGAVPLGTTNMDEFAMGSSGEHSAYGATRNPWDETRTPGGSSAGSAAVVAAGLLPAALGSDTGGSVRQPAAFCGLVGYKPSYGRVSRHGLVAFGSSLDQIGPLCHDARDAALLTSVLAGADGRDATALDEPAPSATPEGTLSGRRLGVPREWIGEGVHAGVRARVEAAFSELANAGAELVELSLPSLAHAVEAYYVVATAEASSNLARYDGVRYGARTDGDGTLDGMLGATRAQAFGAEVRRRILLGTYVLSSGYQDAWYVPALKVRARIAQELAQAFESVDLLVGPTSPVPAFALGERMDDPLAMYSADLMTVPASLAGLPALSLSCGSLDEGGVALPVGLQFVGPERADERVLAAAIAYQAESEHHLARAPRWHGEVGS